MASPLGLFGGTFDPVHFGHLRLAAELREALSLERVAFLPAGIPWQRGGQTHAQGAHRAAMLRLATAGDDGLVVDERELSRAGDTYTVDTLREVRAEAGADRPVVFLCGSDAFAKIETWHRWESLFDLAHFAVAARADDADRVSRGPVALPEPLRHRVTRERRDLLSAPAGRIITLAMTPLAISSTAIRELAKAGSTIRYLTPDPVVGYIRQHSLYGNPA